MSTNQKTSITAQGTTIEFATWVSAKFQRLKGDESRRLSLDWNLSHQMATEYAIKLEATKAINTPDRGQFDTKNGFQVPFYPLQAAVCTEGAV